MPRFSRSGSAAEEAERMTAENVNERLKEGKAVPFKVKYEGCYPVTEARGVGPVRLAFKELKKEKEERRKRGLRHSPYKEVAISLESVQIRDLDTLEAEETYPIRNISYIVNDERNRSYMGMIAHGENDGFVCIILKQDEGRARDVVQALGQAFDLAYQQHLQKDGKRPPVRVFRKTTPQSDAISDQADEISLLRMRLRDLAVLVPPEKLELYLRKQRISEITELPMMEKALKENVSSPENKKASPIVGPQLKELDWDDTTGDLIPLSESRTPGKRGRTSSSPKESAAEVPKVNPPPNSSRNRRPRAISSYDDPFAMGDFNAVEFQTFDQQYIGYGETVRPKPEVTADDLLS